jgi:hypothetical protein
VNSLCTRRSTPILTMLYYSSKGLGIALVFSLPYPVSLSTLIVLLNPLLGLVNSNLHHLLAFGVIRRGLGNDGKVPQKLKGVRLLVRVRLRTLNRGSVSVRSELRGLTHDIHFDGTKECVHSTALLYWGSKKAMTRDVD